MEKLSELWKKAKSAVSRGFGRGDEVAVTKGSDEREQLSNRPLATPAVDILESDKELLVVADVPGAKKGDTLVSVDGENTLVLYAAVEEGDGRSAIGGEYRTIDWYRSFHLPSAFDGKRARAALESGVLTIKVPRRKESAPRLIPVKARG